MSEHRFTAKQKKRIAICGIILFLLLVAVFCWFIGRPMLQFASDPEQMRLWIDRHGIGGKLAYIGMCVIQVVIAVIPGEPIEISGGYAFGIWEGSFLCLLGLFLGSILVFAVVRRFGQPLVDIFFPLEKLQNLRFLQNSPQRDLLFWLIFIIPGTPKDLLCYFAGLTDLSWGKWLLLSSVGRIPAVVSSVIGGNALGLANYKFAILTFVIVLVLSLAGMLFYRLVCRFHQRHKDRHSKM